ncbi:putative kinesin-like protein [Plasmopara halstedii]
MTADRSRPERIEEQDSVQVCVRIRPLTSKEKQEQLKSCIRFASSFHGLSSTSDSFHGPQQLIVGKDRAFTFDNVLGVTSSQADTYHKCVAPLVQGFLAGYNATVLAYGQTGTGKTYTMAGAGLDARGREKTGTLQGIIPRVITAVFEKLQLEEESSDNQHRCDHTLRVEYVEIYNEELRDLLHPETLSKQLAIREDGEGNIVVAGVKSEPADSKEAVFRHFIVGGTSRVTGSTLMNELSSRSHAIFTLLLEQRDAKSGLRRFSKFHLVDLAGSERAKRTGAVANRFKESVSINQGLLALGNVISALGDDKRRVGTAGGSIHVPYRDSKLTRLLQDSLGGNSRTLMIACVSPASVSFEETLNTLKYANRAKNIKNKPIVNDRVASEEERLLNDKAMTRMKEEIANLQTQLQLQKTMTPSSDLLSQTHLSNLDHERSTESEHELAKVSCQLGHAIKCVTLYEDAVESMRSYSREAATLLVVMEREIKSLGRPVQQRLNEIVKLLNTSIQTANCSVLGARKLLPSPSQRLAHEHDSTTTSQQEPESIVVQQLRHELREAKTNLTRDEEIFEKKNADIKKQQALLLEAKCKNEKLIRRVQELERGGQMWSNSEGIGSGHSNEQESSSRTNTPSPGGRSSRSSLTSRSSRGLFSRCASSTAYSRDDDKVVMDTDNEPIEESRYPSVSAPRKSRNGDATGSSRGSIRGSHLSDHRLKTSDAIKKLESTITALQQKLEELQKKNEELLDAREESTRRWALERQTYERQLSEAEHSVETLKRENQTFEHSVVDDACREAKDSKSRYSSSSVPCRSPTKAREETDAAEVKRSERPLTARKSFVKESINKETLFAAFESSVNQLIEYHTTRREVVHLLKEKKVAEQSRSEATRRVNALELQKLRQSVSVRESISDLSESLRALDERMLVESKSLGELERLKKLRARAEQKLDKLRQREEQADFLDTEAQQELQDLEELIVDLDSHIAFQDAELAAARNDLMAMKQRSDAANTKSPLKSLAHQLVKQLKLDKDDDTDAVASVMTKCLDELARLRMRVSDMDSEVHELQGLLNEREAVINQLESGLAVARTEFDRRLATQQQESAEALEQMKRMQPQVLVPTNEANGESDSEWQKLIVRCQKKDEYIADLEKHVVFYKAKAKQMQAQLQQLIRYSTEQQQCSEDENYDSERERQLQCRIQQLEDANDELMKDLATAKVYLRASQSRASTSKECLQAKVVRVSRSNLRELPEPPAPPKEVKDKLQALGRKKLQSSAALSISLESVLLSLNALAFR